MPPPVPAAEAARQRAQRQRLRRRVTAWVFAVPLFLLACALYLLLGPKPPPPPIVLSVTPQQSDQAEQRVEAFRQALTQPPAPAAPPAPARPETPDTPETSPSPPRPRALPSPAVRHAAGPQGEDVVTLQLSQADINAYLAGSKKLKAALEAKGVHAVSVELTPPNLITFHADATLKGLSGDGLVTAAMTPDPKTSVHLDITDARFGRLPPPIVKAAADQIITRLLASPQRPPSLSVRKVEVKGFDLILTGVENGKNPAH